ncbi:MAG: hypothetical protein IJS10_00985 [Alphaproteobacteria bacterium]|nr:hypothetical protein [Alphaproteobacteria bacterium]
MEFKSNVAYKLNQEKCASWIKEDLYKESIYNVISNAIADCVLKRNEFAKDKVKDGVVTFDNKNYESYTAENWNAVVLYNLVQYVYSLKKNKKQQDGGKGDEKMTVANIREKFLKEYIDNGTEGVRLQVECGTDYKDKIRWAYNDIMEYDTALSIIKYMMSKQFNNIWEEGTTVCADYDKKGFADIEIDSNDLYNKSYAFNNSDEKAESGKSDMRIIVKGGKVADAVVYGAKAMYNCDLDDYMNIKYKAKVQEYKYPKDVFSSEKMESLYREEESGEESSIDVSPGKTMITEGLIASWYEKRDEFDKTSDDHLNWILVDELYTKKSYITPTKKINLIFCTTNTDGYKHRLILGDECLNDISLPSYENNNKCQEYLDIGLKMKEGTYIETDKKCKSLINDSKSITTIDLAMAIGWNSEVREMPELIEENENLQEVNLTLTNTNGKTTCAGMIARNCGLKNINLTMNGYSLYDLQRMINNNEQLEKVTIDFEHSTADHTNVSSMIADCKNLKEVHLKNTNTKDGYGYEKRDVYTDVLLNDDDVEGNEDDENKIFPGCPEDVYITIENK